MSAIIQFESEIVLKLIHNCESWLGLDDTHTKWPKDIQDNSLKQVLAAPGTPKGMVELDGQMVQMERRKEKQWPNTNPECSLCTPQCADREENMQRGGLTNRVQTAMQGP